MSMTNLSKTYKNMDILKIIEELRKDKRISKTKLSKNAGINVRTYYRYLDNGEIPFTVAYNMLNYLGYTFVVGRNVKYL